MSDIVIKVENLSKKYVLSHQGQKRYTALRDVMANGLKRFGKKLLAPFPSHTSHYTDSHEDFYALSGVSFEIKRGERVGIIGRNGAGKSTLLKILSRITEPTAGRIEITGRVASLLEVGTGFHPELTGRENIFLNGAVLGMARADIKRKFDEIVAFAEIEKFLDTPVKRYSSGMYVRLAFAVAAHMEPEILVVDEVLAVGDAGFQKKCLGKMEDVGKEGRTVLFVSHQMGSIARLCSKALLLDKGSILKEGESKETIEFYMNSLTISSDSHLIVEKSDKDIYFAKIQSLNSKLEPVSYYSNEEPVLISITCRVNKWVPDTVLGFYVIDHRGRKVFTNNSDKWKKIIGTAAEINMIVTIPGNFLVPGHYTFTFVISVERVRAVDIVHDAVVIKIVDTGTEFAAYEGDDYGCVFADCKWKLV